LLLTSFDVSSDLAGNRDALCKPAREVAEFDLDWARCGILLRSELTQKSRQT